MDNEGGAEQDRAGPEAAGQHLSCWGVRRGLRRHQELGEQDQELPVTSEPARHRVHDGGAREECEGHHLGAGRECEEKVRQSDERGQGEVPTSAPGRH